MLILRKKSFAKTYLPGQINVSKVRDNAKNGIISTQDQALLKLIDKYGVAVGKVR